jgi:hypothetical protein
MTYRRRERLSIAATNAITPTTTMTTTHQGTWYVFNVLWPELVVAWHAEIDAARITTLRRRFTRTHDVPRLTS